jgi:hypothetical protein
MSIRLQAGHSLTAFADAFCAFRIADSHEQDEALTSFNKKFSYHSRESRVCVIHFQIVSKLFVTTTRSGAHDNSAVN